MTDPLVRLRQARSLDSETAVEAFEQALADLPETLDPATLDALHLILDDDTVVPEVMYDLVHRLERTPMGDQEASVIRVLPELSATAPWWAETIVMRLLNNVESRRVLMASLDHAPADRRIAMRAVLERIAAGPDAVGGIARSTIAALDAGSGARS